VARSSIIQELREMLQQEPGAWMSNRALPAGNYAYRVRGVNSIGLTGPWSEPTSFTVDLGAIPPAVPRILEVPGGLGLLPLEFAWTVEAQAASYDLKLVQVLANDKSERVYQKASTSASLIFHHVFDVGDYQAFVRARNGSGVTPWSSGVNFTLQAAPGWRNPRDPLDVNRDQLITPRDALVVINYLNAGLLWGRLPDVRPSSDPPTPFLDVNGDGRSTPRDALDVINFINAGFVHLGAEGEGWLPTASEQGTIPTSAGSSGEAYDLLALLAFDVGTQARRRK
jgi:hypothetical protein